MIDLLNNLSALTAFIALIGLVVSLSFFRFFSEDRTSDSHLFFTYLFISSVAFWGLTFAIWLFLGDFERGRQVSGITTVLISLLVIGSLFLIGLILYLQKSNPWLAPIGRKVIISCVATSITMMIMSLFDSDAGVSMVTATVGGVVFITVSLLARNIGEN